ncbi:unnamed protein product [Camellia sinensis]
MPPIAQLMFSSHLTKSKAEKYKAHILLAFESVLGSPVTIEIRCEFRKDARAGVNTPLILLDSQDGTSLMRTNAELTSGNSMTALGYGDTSKRVPKERASVSQAPDSLGLGRSEIIEINSPGGQKNNEHKDNNLQYDMKDLENPWIGEILKEENSLELIMSSYQLLNELDKPNPDPRIHAPTIAKVLLKSRGFFTKVFLNGCDIDAADVDNELVVVKYVEDIYKFCKLTEVLWLENSASFSFYESRCILGEAKSAQLIGQAIANNPAFITPRKIEAAREIAHTISNSANKVFLTSDELLLNLQETNLGTSTGQKVLQSVLPNEDEEVLLGQYDGYTDD